MFEYVWNFNDMQNDLAPLWNTNTLMLLQLYTFCWGPASIYTVVNMICCFAFSVKLWCVSDEFGWLNISCPHYTRICVIGVKGVGWYIIGVAVERTHNNKENI